MSTSPIKDERQSPLKPLHPWKPHSPDERYRPAAHTDIRETFARARMNTRSHARRVKVPQ